MGLPRSSLHSTWLCSQDLAALESFRSLCLQEFSLAVISGAEQQQALMIPNNDMSTVYAASPTKTAIFPEQMDCDIMFTVKQHSGIYKKKAEPPLLCFCSLANTRLQVIGCLYNEESFSAKAAPDCAFTLQGDFLICTPLKRFHLKKVARKRHSWVMLKHSFAMLKKGYQNVIGCLYNEESFSAKAAPDCAFTLQGDFLICTPLKRFHLKKVARKRHSWVMLKHSFAMLKKGYQNTLSKASDIGLCQLGPVLSICAVMSPVSPRGKVGRQAVQAEELLFRFAYSEPSVLNT
ncbi:Early Growth Response Protein 1 [Manis pentadactyla]|nr:Early Growth Response Protein 1 [Manis pentadactyla]